MLSTVRLRLDCFLWHNNYIAHLKLNIMERDMIIGGVLFICLIVYVMGIIIYALNIDKDA